MPGSLFLVTRGSVSGRLTPGIACTRREVEMEREGQDMERDPMGGGQEGGGQEGGTQGGGQGQEGGTQGGGQDGSQEGGTQGGNQ